MLKMGKSKPRDIPKLVEGIDFYYENGFMVFTKKYHRDRGFCCGNSCRHCPYGHENVRQPG